MFGDIGRHSNSIFFSVKFQHVKCSNQLCQWDLEHTDYICYRRVRHPLPQKGYPVYDTKLHLVVRL